PVVFADNGKEFKAIALPGNDTKALGGLGLQDLDVDVPIGGKSISLTRHYHSFSQPADLFGQGWTLDLPQLLKQRLVTARTEKESSSRSVYQLVSPLGTWNESFTEEKNVPGFKFKVLVPR